MKIFLMAFMISTALFGGSFDTIPNEFFVTERWFSFSTTFDIETKAQKLGTVHRRVFSLTTQYDFYDWEENLITNSRMRFFSFGVVFDVTDANGETLGTVNEKIFNFFPTFEIINPEGNVLAIAKRNFWNTSYMLRDPVDQHVIGTFYRPFFRLRSGWTMHIEDANVIDPRLLITIAAFQTDCDHWEAQRNKYKMKGVAKAEVDAMEHFLNTFLPDTLTPPQEFKLLESLLHSDELTPPQKQTLRKMIEMRYP